MIRLFRSYFASLRTLAHLKSIDKTLKSLDRKYDIYLKLELLRSEATEQEILDLYNGRVAPPVIVQQSQYELSEINRLYDKYVSVYKHEPPEDATADDLRSILGEHDG